jgi:hypothetical protein
MEELQTEIEALKKKNKELEEKLKNIQTAITINAITKKNKEKIKENGSNNLKN